MKSGMAAILLLTSGLLRQEEDLAVIRQAGGRVRAVAGNRSIISSRRSAGKCGCPIACGRPSECRNVESKTDEYQ